MLRYMLKSKIHRATITDANLHYEGSLTIDRQLIEQADLRPFERINIYNINNGKRFDTYVIEGPPGSGIIGLNGAAARNGVAGDLIIIASYALYSPEDLATYRPCIVLVDEHNRVKERADK